MISVNKDNAADIVRNILRQSQAVKGNIQSKESGRTIEKKGIFGEVSYSQGASLTGPDNDLGKSMYKKEQKSSLFIKDESFFKTKGFIESILNRMTSQDYRRLFEEGFNPEDLTVESLSEAVRLIKDYYGIAALKDFDPYEKNEESKKTGEITEREIENRMKAENLPVNKDSVGQVSGALKMSEDIPLLENKDIMYLLNNGMSPTIENLYKARYSSQYGGSQAKISEKEWKALIPQVRQIIEESGKSADKEIYDDARRLIENNIPLTKENLDLLTGVKRLTRDYSKDHILDRIIDGMKEGTMPQDVIPVEDINAAIDDISRPAAQTYAASVRSIERLIGDIQRITDSDILRAVDAYDEATIEDLEKIHGEDAGEDRALEGISDEKLAKYLTAKRQLEEIRLKMTLEAAVRLEKKGFHIETETLQSVVERLRLEEENYYRELYRQAMPEAGEPDEASVKLLMLTSETAFRLKYMPAYILGATLSERSRQTMPGLLAAGQSMKAELDKAQKAYEPLLTMPKAEYGDSIKKAFSNMGSLMEEMGIEDTELNRRAVRILGYNGMEITHESIEKVKAYDLSVNYLLKNLNPQIALRIIRSGINPMDMSIDDLNRHIDMLKKQGYLSLDKYSTYLYKLEREEGISEEERKAYIGIYRLLYQIEKSDGAALGAVIKADREVTLNHLLTAVRTIKKGPVNYRIDDGFGVLEEMTSGGDTISDQLNDVFKYGTVPYQEEAGIKGEIQNAIIKELLENLTPAKLYRLYADFQNSAFNNGEEAESKPGIWDLFGNTSVERLLDSIRDLPENPEENQGYYDDRMRVLQDILRNSEQSIRFLNAFDMPCTAANLMMAGHVLNNGTAVFKKLFGLASKKDEEDNEDKEKLRNSLKKKLDLTDTLIDNMSMTEAYEQLEQEVKAVIDDEIAREDNSYDEIMKLKLMGMHVSFLKNLAKREFYQIPIETSGKITNINLTIVRGNGMTGRVTVLLDSEKLGSIRAEAVLKGNRLSGYIACDNAESLGMLEKQADPLIMAMQEEEVTVSHLNFCLMQAPDTIFLPGKPGDDEVGKNPGTEKILYKAAKAIIYMIRNAEEE